MSEYAATLSPRALAYATSGPKSLLIGGKWLAARSGKTIETINPDTGEVLTTVALADARDLDDAVAAARAAFEHPSWAKITPYQRSNFLLKIADAIEANIEELAVIQTLDMGLLIAQSRALVASQVDVFRYFAGWPTKIYGKTMPSDQTALAYTRREPLGVVGAIIPWNGPMLATSWKIAPALAAGNTVVFKASEVAPLVSLRLAELIQETGLPAGVLNMIVGTGDVVGQAMVEHPGIDKINFTGSTKVGKGIFAAAASTMKKVTLEMGGKSPTIIFADADLEKAASAAVMGFTAGAGQGCYCTTRVLIHESVYDQVTDMIAQQVNALRIGSPFDPDTMVGPLVSKAQFDRVMAYIQSGKEEGATLKAGGAASQRGGLYVEPTVFSDTHTTMKIVREEIFGPVGALIPFKDDEDAIRIANDTTYGLAAGLWTRDVSRAHIVAGALQAGTVWVNTSMEVDIMAPFGGYKQSGAGRELGEESIEAHTQVKSIVVRF